MNIITKQFNDLIGKPDFDKDANEAADKFPDYDHFKNSMKVLKGQEYKVEYIVEVKDPYSSNNITITS